MSYEGRSGGMRMRIRNLGFALIVAPVVLLAACSSGQSHPQVASLKSDATSSAPGAAPSSSADITAAYDKCMREHGSNRNDPAPAGGGGMIELSPTDLTAAKACASIMSAGQDTTKADQDAIARATKQAACMRSNGISGWPDPLVAPSGGSTDSIPTTEPGGTVVANSGGTYFQLPASIDMASPKVQAAFKVCWAGDGSGTTVQLTGSAGAN
jgi:hypothetical protein